MSSTEKNAVPKVHPATRGIEPEDPMSLRGFEVPGDPELMLRMLVEEFAHMGYDVDELMHLASNPFYRALHGLLRLYGEDELRRKMTVILSRCGVVRVTTRTAPNPDQIVNLTLPPEGKGRDDHGHRL